MISDNPPIDIRQMTFSDIPKVLELQQRVFPGFPTCENNELACHLVVFPEGHLVATDETKQILGSASSLIIDVVHWLDLGQSSD
jgi:hypothetical protein